MNVVVVGLGKLGYPLALAIDAADHRVVGVERDPDRRAFVDARLPIAGERGGDRAVEHTISTVASCAEVDWSAVDVTLVVVDTPHPPGQDGSELLSELGPFELTSLRSAIGSLPPEVVPVIVSTVLPGTCRVLGRPVVYSPAFPAMGTVLNDLADPDLVVIGHDGLHVEAVESLTLLYRSLGSRVDPVVTDVTTAEGIKVLYNTALTAKVTLANLYGELAERLGMNADVITDTLARSRRISGPAYTRAGMGDGGPCHPRDNLALAHLANEIGLSFNIFSALLLARQNHVRWLVTMIPDHAVIFGTAYKSDSEITDGSAAVLLGNMLTASGRRFTQGEDPDPGEFNVIATAHARYREIIWPKGSTVLDPFGIIADQERVTVKRIGRR